MIGSAVLALGAMLCAKSAPGRRLRIFGALRFLIAISGSRPDLAKVYDFSDWPHSYMASRLLKLSSCFGSSLRRKNRNLKNEFILIVYASETD